MPYTKEQLGAALKAAHEAGDYASAQKLADALRNLVTEAPAFDVDTTPISVEPRRSPNKMGGYTNWNQKELDLAKQGIALDKPNSGPLTTEDYANLFYTSAGPEYSRKWIGKKVKDFYKYPGDPEKLTKQGPNGEILYLDLSLKRPRWKAVDPGVAEGLLDPTTAKRMVGEFTSNVAATTAAAFTTFPAGPVVATGTGAAAGGSSDAIWRYQALKRGQQLGINEGLDDEQLKQMAVGRGMTSFGLGLLFGAPTTYLNKAAQADANMFRNSGGTIADNVAESITDTNAKVDATNELAQRRLGSRADETFDPSLPQRAAGVKGAQDPLNIEATIQAQHMAKATDALSKKITDRQVKNKRILTQIWDTMFPEAENNPVAAGAAGERARQGALDTALNSPEMTYELEASRRLEQINKELDALDTSITPEDVLTVVRGERGPHVEGDTYNPNSTKFYATLENLTQQQVKLSEAVRIAGQNANVEISDKNLLRPELERIVSKSKLPSPGLESDEAATLVSGILADLDKYDGRLPWAKFDADYQRLGQLIENRSSGNVQKTDKSITVAELEQIRSVFDRAVEGPQGAVRTGNTPIRATDLVDYWKRRKAVTTLKHDIFEGKVVRKLLATEDPEKVMPSQFVNDLFPTEGAEYLKILVGHVKGDDEAMGALRSLMLKRYNAAVRPNGGEFSLDAHNRFIAEHKAQLDVLFDGQQHKPFEVVGTLANEIASANAIGKARAQATKKAWYNIVGEGSIKKDMSATDVINNIIALRASPGQLRSFMAWADRNNPETAALIRKQMLSDLRAQYTTADGPPSAKALRQLASDSYGKGSRLFAVMGSAGPQFQKDLLTLADAVEIANRKGKSLGQPGTDFGTAAARVIYGPLSRIQRFITGAKQFSKWMDANRAYEVISDPERLHRALVYGSTAPRAEVIPTTIAMDIGALYHILSNDRPKD